jgi:hypothetical protein
MINFRVHIASLIAVFLALALGVVMGSTVIDRAIVEGLRDRIDRAEENSNAVRAENNDLKAERDSLNEYVGQSAPWAVDNQLIDQSVAIIAERGVNEETVQQQAALLTQADGSVPGILWLEEPWNLGGDGKNADALRTALGTTTRDDKELRAEGISALANRLAQGSAVTSDSDVVDALAKAGFVTLEGVGDGDVTAATFPGTGVRALVLGGADSSITARTTAVELTRALVANDTVTAVGELDPDDPAAERGTWITPIRTDDALKATVSTIDNVDEVQGRVASALAVADLIRGIVGAYGTGSGATATVPPAPATG